MNDWLEPRPVATELLWADPQPVPVPVLSIWLSRDMRTARLYEGTCVDGSQSVAADGTQWEGNQTLGIYEVHNVPHVPFGRLDVGYVVPALEEANGQVSLHFEVPTGSEASWRTWFHLSHDMVLEYLDALLPPQF